MAWLSGPFAFCSVTELLPWPESGAAAARARRAQFATRAGSLPAQPRPDPARPGSTLRYIRSGCISLRAEKGQQAAQRRVPAVSGQVRAGARERTLHRRQGARWGPGRVTLGMSDPGWSVPPGSLNCRSETGGEEIGQVLRSSRLPQGPRSLPDAASLTLAPS